MHITLNGDAREFPLDTTVNELLDTLGYAGKRVACGVIGIAKP